MSVRYVLSWTNMYKLSISENARIIAGTNKRIKEVPVNEKTNERTMKWMNVQGTDIKWQWRDNKGLNEGSN